jgi:hypothetical protein
MKFSPSHSYEKIDQRTLGNKTMYAWVSRKEDACWDKFLQETPLGQFQQSTFWAQTKSTEGWRPLRVMLTVNEEMVGGFQILWRPSWFGRMGYVSKGPVVLPGFPELADYATELLQKLAERERLRALVVQPPDLCKLMSARLAENGFLLAVSANVIEATWVVDLRDGFGSVVQRMHRKTRRKAKQALERGIKIREGGRDDIQTFFDIMLLSCRRQQVAPNPPDVRTLLKLWDAAQPAGLIRLTLAEWEGKPLAGQIDICFGQTVTQWKKGWNSSEAKRFPNDLLMYQALQWATSSGFHFSDFAGFDKSMALTILNGEPLTPEQEKSWYLFILRAGGSPRLLPEARVYFPNRVIRLAYRVMFYKKIRQAKKICRLVEQATHFAGSRTNDLTT